MLEDINNIQKLQFLENTQKNYYSLDSGKSINYSDKNPISSPNSFNFKKYNSFSDVFIEKDLLSNKILESKIFELQSKLLITEQREYNLKREIILLKSELSDIKFKFSKDNQSQLIEFDENEVKELILEIDELKKENTIISERALNMLTEKEVCNMKLKEEINELRRVIKLQEVKILPDEQYSTNLDSLEFKLEGTRNSFAVWNEERENLYNIIQDLEQRILSIQNEHRIELLKYKIIEKDQENENACEENDNTSFILERKLSERESYYKSKIKILKNEMDELIRENSSYTEKIEILNYEISQLRLENANKVISIKKDSNYDKQIIIEESEFYKNRLLNLEKENELNMMKLEICNNECSELREEIKKLKVENEQLKSNYQENNNVINQSMVYKEIIVEKEENKEYESEIINLRLKIEKLENEIINLNKKLKIKETRRVNSRICGEMEILKNEIKKYQNDIKETREVYEKQIKDLVSKIQDNNTRNSIIRSNGPRNTLKIIDMEEKLQNYKRENVLLRETLEKLTDNLEYFKNFVKNILDKVKEDNLIMKKIATDTRCLLSDIINEKEIEIIKYKCSVSENK